MHLRRCVHSYAVAFRQEYSEFRDRDAAEAYTRSGQLSNPGIQFGLRVRRSKQ